MAVSFDGTDDYAEADIPSLFSNIPGNSFSISCWLNFGDITGNPTTFMRAFEAYYDANNFVQITIQDTNGDLGINLQTSVLTVPVQLEVAVDSAISADTWYHVVITWDTGTLRMYLDSVEQNGVGATNAGGGGVQVMNFGRRGDGSAATYSDVDMADFRIYNRVLPADEVSTIFKSRGHDTIFDSLIRRYEFKGVPAESAVIDTGFIAVQTASIDSTNLSVNVPTHSSGDLLIGIICSSGDATGTAPTINTPVGWTSVGTVALPSTTSTPRLSVFRRTAGASEPASYNWTINQTNSICGIMASYDGGTYSTTEENATSNTGTSATPSASTISPTASSVILRICAADGANLPTGISTFYPDNTIGRAALEKTGIGNGCAVGFSDHKVPSGATGAATFTLFASDEWATFSISFNGGDGDTETSKLKDVSNNKVNAMGYGGATFTADVISWRRRV